MDRKQEIAESLNRIGSEVREAIVFAEVPAAPAMPQVTKDIFAEMAPFMVGAQDADSPGQFTEFDPCRLVRQVSEFWS